MIMHISIFQFATLLGIAVAIVLPLPPGIAGLTISPSRINPPDAPFQAVDGHPPFSRRNSVLPFTPTARLLSSMAEMDQSVPSRSATSASGTMPHASSETSFKSAYQAPKPTRPSSARGAQNMTFVLGPASSAVPVSSPSVGSMIATKTTSTSDNVWSALKLEVSATPSPSTPSALSGNSFIVIFLPLFFTTLACCWFLFSDNEDEDDKSNLPVPSTANNSTTQAPSGSSSELASSTVGPATDASRSASSTIVAGTDASSPSLSSTIATTDARGSADNSATTPATTGYQVSMDTRS